MSEGGRPRRRRSWPRGLVIGLVVIVAIGLAAGLWIVSGPGPTAFAGGGQMALADYHGANPSGVPAALANASQVQRGEYLARAADCKVCHTAPGGNAFAGGFAFTQPFGRLYSTNITPDQETGIGAYSDAQFLAAVRRGVRRDGERLYPAMPFASYGRLHEPMRTPWRSRPIFQPSRRSTRPTGATPLPFPSANAG